MKRFSILLVVTICFNTSAAETKPENILLSCNGNTINFSAGSSRSSDFDTYWENVTIKGNKLIVPEYGDFEHSYGNHWVNDSDGRARVSKAGGKLIVTLYYRGGKWVSQQLQANCKTK
jgi:hypothetical protein